MASLRLGSCVEQLGGTLHGSPDALITGLAPLSAASAGHISFLSHPKYISQLESSQATCVVVSEAHAEMAMRRGHCIVTPDPYVYWAHLTQWWAELQPKTAVAQVHPTAVVDPTAVIHPSARIGPLCVIEGGAHVGEGSWLKSRVTVSHECAVGKHCTLHSGVVIGADGFGFAMDGERWIKIEQLGRAVIGDHVEIGANTCIDRGALEDTVIEDGVILDNLIQIGHNVKVGKHTAMAGCAGVAGSTTIGAYCTIGAGAGILGHLTLVDHVHVSAYALVTHSLTKPGTYSGVFPIDENARWHKNAASLKQLSQMRERLKQLEQQSKN